MKKLLSILMVLVIMFAFASCSSKEYTDTPVTEIVTDENGEPVTDENGNPVTVVAESTTGEDASATSSGQDTTAPSGSGSSTTAATTAKANTPAKTTAKKTTTTTTEKPTKSQKRDIKVIVELPFYNEKETDITVSYRVDGDKKYKDLEPKKNVKLDKTGKQETFTIPNVKGDVDISVSFSGTVGANISKNTATAKASDKDQTVTIRPATGIEVMEDMD